MCPLLPSRKGKEFVHILPQKKRAPETGALYKDSNAYALLEHVTKAKAYTKL